MFQKNKDAIYYPENLFIWFLLAFQGGIVNVGGFLAVHRFVSHVTGFATWFGVEASGGNYIDAFGMLLSPLFYLIGAMTSAWMIERRRMKNLQPLYGVVLGIMSFLFFLVVIGGTTHFFGEFGEPFNYERDYVLLFILTFSCGLQNAVVSSASGAVVRTTHLTGLTTDLGIGLVRLWTDRKHFNKRDQNEASANFFRFGIIMSFIIGSLVGALIFQRIHFLGFLIPMIVSIFVFIKLRSELRL